MDELLATRRPLPPWVLWYPLFPKFAEERLARIPVGLHPAGCWRRTKQQLRAAAAATRNAILSARPRSPRPGAAGDAVHPPRLQGRRSRSSYPGAQRASAAFLLGAGRRLAEPGAVQAALRLLGGDCPGRSYSVRRCRCAGAGATAAWHPTRRSPRPPMVAPVDAAHAAPVVGRRRHRRWHRDAGPGHRASPQAALGASVPASSD